MQAIFEFEEADEKPQSDANHEWLKQHGAIGVLLPEEVQGLGEASIRVMRLMADKQWHDANEIRAAAGGDGPPASEGLRRMRDLRPQLESRGFCIIKSRSKDTRVFTYKISETVKSE